MVGKTISHYQILEKLGEGGMGVVYKARDTHLDRFVAIKVLPAEKVADPERKRRFVQEAKAASALNHPNIIHVYDIDQQDGVDYIAMEHVQGKTLSQLIGRKGLKLGEALKYGVLIADALSRAHAAGIIHRDLKPGNIMVDEHGLVKLLDFGLAKLTEAAPLGENESTRTLRPTTEEGTIVGTVAYMSPEQAEGKPLDARSDIFSFGAVLYEMLTGRRAFQEESKASTLGAVIHKEPEPLGAEAPHDLEKVITRCLRKDPDKRFHHMVDVRVALDELKEESDSGRLLPAAQRPPAAAEVAVSLLTRRRVALLGGAALLALALMSLGLYRFVWQKPVPSFQAMKLTMLTATGKVHDAVISPDGKYLAYVVADAGMQSLWVRQTATSSSVQIVPPGEARHHAGLTFSLDGNYIYDVRAETKGSRSFGTLYEVPVLGGAAKKLIADVDSPVAISPDGKQLAFVRGRESEQDLVVVNVDGTAERKLATSKFPTSFRFEGPAWSPDGKIIAVGSEGEVVAVQVADGNERTLASNLHGSVGRVAWLADGRGLLLSYFDSGFRWQIWHLAYPSGQVRRITNDPNNYEGVSVTADDKALVTVSTKSSTRFWTIPQGEWSRPHDISPGTSEEDGRYGFSWMPDGRILYASGPYAGTGLRVMNGDGSNAKEFPVPVEAGLGVSACPDGRYVVFHSLGGFERVDSEGGNLKRLTAGYGLGPRCSPDSKWVAYVSGRADNYTLWRIPIEGGAPVQLRDKPTRWCAISPDGKSIVCIGQDAPTQPTKLIVLPSQGGPPSKTFDEPDVRAVDWAPDGRSLTFSATRKGASNVWTQPLAGGPPKQLTDFERSRSSILSLAWSPDGKHLALVRSTYASDAVLIGNFKGSEK